MNENSMYTDDLTNSKWLGEVIDNEDPDYLGKVRIKVWGKFDLLDDDMIPWALPGNLNIAGSSTGAGNHSAPKKGSIVHVEFENGNLYTPIYYTLRRISNELKDKIGNDDYYKNAQVLVYDTETNVYLYHILHGDYGMLLRTKKDDDDGSNQIWFKDNDDIQIKNANKREITLSKDNILVKNKDGKVVHITDNEISIGSENGSAEPAVLGNKNADVLSKLAKSIQDIIQAIQNATTTPQDGGASFKAALVAALATTLSDVIQIQSTDAEQTKSQVVTLD